MDGPTARRLLLEASSRRRIHGLIERVPGIHMRRIARELELPFGTVEYHLYQLSRFGLVKALQQGRKKAYFLTNTFDREDERYLYYLRHRTTRWILELLLEDPKLTPRRLARRVRRGVPTVSYHLRKLVHAKIVEPLWAGRTKNFRLVDAARLGRLFDAYNGTFRVARPAYPPVVAVDGHSDGYARNVPTAQHARVQASEILPESPSEY